MELPFILKSFFDDCLEIDKLDLIIDYITQKTDNTKPIREKLSVEDPLYKFIYDFICGHKPPFFIFAIGRNMHIYLIEKNLLNQFKNIVVENAKNKLSCLSFIPIVNLLFANNVFEKINGLSKSIVEMLSIYYVILPIVLDALVHTDTIDIYIQKKLVSYDKLLQSNSKKSLLDRLEQLKNAYQQHETIKTMYLVRHRLFDSPIHSLPKPILNKILDDADCNATKQYNLNRKN